MTGSPRASGSGRLRVLHVVPSFYPAVRYGGPIESLLRLCQALEPFADVEVATTNADGPGALDVPTDRAVDVRGVRVRYFMRWPRIGFAPSAPLVAHLRREIGRFDVVHVTAAFAFPSTAACRLARSQGVPYVVSPRGSCRAWALGHKRWKKAPYWTLLERSNLTHAAALHATSDEERDELRAILPRSDVRVIPNGVDLPATETAVERSGRRVVFLGRLHPVKALDRLLAAMALVTRRIPDVELVLAGPDDVGEWRKLERQRELLSPRPSVTYLGAVSGTAKDALLAGASLLVLPSHTENFGQVVVEALAQGTPVVASTHTPWRVLESSGAGRWVSNEPESLAGAIEELLTTPERAETRAQAARGVAASFAWSSVGERMTELYRAVAEKRGAAARP